MKLRSTLALGAKLLKVSAGEVKNEPMIFSCSLAAASKLGGPLTKAFLDALPNYWIEPENIIIDSRVHMLMPGWFPCIPGWHHDDVPRTREDGQPDYVNPSYKAEHCMALMGDDIASTEFALGEADLPEVPLGQTVYKVWHGVVEKLLKSRQLDLFTVPMHQIIDFDWLSFHQGVRAHAGGWRFFIRASRNTGRESKDEIRRQVQVYLENPMEGW